MDSNISSNQSSMVKNSFMDLSTTPLQYQEKAEGKLSMCQFSPEKLAELAIQQGIPKAHRRLSTFKISLLTPNTEEFVQNMVKKKISINFHPDNLF